MKKTFAQVCCNLISNIFDKNNLEHKSKNNRILVRSANKKMLIDFNDMTLTFDDEENPRFRMKKFVKVSYNNMMEMRKRYENKLTELAKYILNDKKIDLRKQALHDIYNRELALLYINGKFYEGYTHAICLQQYLEEEKNNYVDSHERYREDEFEKYTSDKDIIAFAHKGKEEYKNYKDFKNDVITSVIFLETSTLQNISEEEAAKLGKLKDGNEGGSKGKQSDTGKADKDNKPDNTKPEQPTGEVNKPEGEVKGPKKPQSFNKRIVNSSQLDTNQQTESQEDLEKMSIFAQVLKQDRKNMRLISNALKEKEKPANTIREIINSLKELNIDTSSNKPSEVLSILKNCK